MLGENQKEKKEEEDVKIKVDELDEVKLVPYDKKNEPPEYRAERVLKETLDDAAKEHVRHNKSKRDENEQQNNIESNIDNLENKL